MMTVGSLFSGIGGIELGLERTGRFQTAWFVENDTYASGVLKKHWPTVVNYGNVTQLDWEKMRKPDILTGGLPCQPFSAAGKRKGEKDERALWKYFLAAICHFKPGWVLAENVPGLLSIDFGKAFRNILKSLAENGYDAEWFPLSASDFGAPHRRERIFLVAYPNRKRGVFPTNEKLLSPDETGGASESESEGRGVWSYADRTPVIFTRNWGERIRRFKQESLQGKQGFSWCENVRGVEDFFGRPDSPEPLIRRESDGFSRKLYDARIRCIGNAVVPQVAQFIGECIITQSSQESHSVRQNVHT